ncbi:hypothetical protein HELRODRAFT_96238 [Helobdella robusta]|uniref:Uncharacterized protein n=1 Tax=Helobdella robusta TaxID=6412 RepID=T1G9A9_HELRO|nr:hypothetical protein HELRODRAFT_96238 [Helobdella robusta]ESN91492.1 hypothetical protein HELRODRAFT_96238 [Helobdella robusta]
MATVFFGCCSPKDPNRRKPYIRSQQIDKQLSKDRSKLRRTIKLLLLGSGESGKSTFIKQMRIINGKEFQPDELKVYKTTIYENIVKGMKVLIDARAKLQLTFQQPASHTHAQFVFSYDNNIKLEEPVFTQYVTSLIELWEDGGIQEAFSRRKEFHLGDSLKYFMENIERISSMSYVPSNQDILHARKPTKSISEYEFIIKGIPFLFVDVGGQRSQRPKWYQCFEAVTCILFLASSSEYDQTLLEDRRANRLVESCDIFDAIVNNKTFANVSIILFLNKTDLLKEKILTSDIRQYFPEQFPSSSDSKCLEDVQKFEVQLFDARWKDRTLPLFHHFTTAVDTENIKFVFSATRETILQNNIKTLMLQ